MQIKSNLFKEKDTKDTKLSYIRHQRNKSGLPVENSQSLNNYKITDESNIIDLIKKNEEILVASINNKNEILHNQVELSNINSEINDYNCATNPNMDTSLNFNIANLLLSLQNFTSEPTYHTERPTSQLKNIMEEVTKPASHRSERRTSNIFTVKDKLSEK